MASKISAKNLYDNINIFENRKCVILIQRILIIKIKESYFFKLVSFIKKNID